MIDVTKPIVTRDGKRVICARRIEKNSCGEKVTYPIKGNIVVHEYPLRTEYQLWSDEGFFDVVWGNSPEKDIRNIGKPICDPKARRKP